MYDVTAIVNVRFLKNLLLWANRSFRARSEPKQCRKKVSQ